MRRLIKVAGFMTAGALAVAVPVGNTVKNNLFKSVEYVKVYDGDTFTVNIPFMPKVFGRNISVRIAHIDAPEINGEGECESAVAREAELALEDLLSSAKSIELINPGRDKYFRILADAKVNGKILLSQYMLDKKLAVPYEGDTKPVTDWCKYSE